eukprot:TRINITY_DN16979_c0_g1_i2.p1 TRINITY_DN16979_c0_g1~~TRINITY_DN16979_c0_g1_i2.p1  ORF type:complete len:856 (+),score=206.01 TRINITY_DN16979_c0_g1_i2:131-2569(+)
MAAAGADASNGPVAGIGSIGSRGGVADFSGISGVGSSSTSGGVTLTRSAAASMRGRDFGSGPAGSTGGKGRSVPKVLLTVPEGLAGTKELRCEMPDGQGLRLRVTECVQPGTALTYARDVDSGLWQCTDLEEPGSVLSAFLGSLGANRGRFVSNGFAFTRDLIAAAAADREMLVRPPRRSFRDGGGGGVRDTTAAPPAPPRAADVPVPAEHAAAVAASASADATEAAADGAAQTNGVVAEASPPPVDLIMPPSMPATSSVAPTPTVPATPASPELVVSTREARPQDLRSGGGAKSADAASEVILVASPPTRSAASKETTGASRLRRQAKPGSGASGGTEAGVTEGFGSEKFVFRRDLLAYYHPPQPLKLNWHSLVTPEEAEAEAVSAANAVAASGTTLCDGQDSGSAAAAATSVACSIGELARVARQALRGAAAARNASAAENGVDGAMAAAGLSGGGTSATGEDSTDARGDAETDEACSDEKEDCDEDLVQAASDDSAEDENDAEEDMDEVDEQSDDSDEASGLPPTSLGMAAAAAAGVPHPNSNSVAADARSPDDASAAAVAAAAGSSTSGGMGCVEAAYTLFEASRLRELAPIGLALEEARAIALEDWTSLGAIERTRRVRSARVVASAAGMANGNAGIAANGNVSHVNGASTRGIACVQGGGGGGTVDSVGAWIRGGVASVGGDLPRSCVVGGPNCVTTGIPPQAIASAAALVPGVVSLPPLPRLSSGKRPRSPSPLPGAGVAPLGEGSDASTSVVVVAASASVALAGASASVSSGPTSVETYGGGEGESPPTIGEPIAKRLRPDDSF